MPFSKFSQVLFHLLGWLLFFSLIIAFTFNAPGGERVMHQIFSWHYLIFYVTFLVIFYLNGSVLMPAFYFGKKHFLYFVIMGVLLVAVYLLSPFDQLVRPNNLPGPPPSLPARGKGGPRFDIISLLLFVMTWSLSSALSIV